MGWVQGEIRNGRTASRFWSLRIWILWSAGMCKEALKNYVDFGVYVDITSRQGILWTFENWKKIPWLQGRRSVDSILPAWCRMHLTSWYRYWRKRQCHYYESVYYPFQYNYKQQSVCWWKSSYPEQRRIRDRLCRLLNRKYKRDDVKLFAFCSPSHNPSEKSLDSKKRLKSVGYLCKKAPCLYILADEIHPGYRYEWIWENHGGDNRGLLMIF